MRLSLRKIILIVVIILILLLAGWIIAKGFKIGNLQIRGIIIERDSISRIEIGTRFVADYELREIAKILNVSVEWLLNT